MGNVFTEADYKTVQQFETFLQKHARWDVSTEEMIRGAQLIVWHASLPNKVKDNIFDLKDAKLTPVKNEKEAKK